MKKGLTVLFLFAFAFVKAQDNKQSIIIKADTSYLQEQLSIPYSCIDVLDARYDQGKIGTIYQLNATGRTNYSKTNAAFPDSLKNYLPVFLHGILHTDATIKDTLFVLIKKFRIADHISYNAAGEEQMESILAISASFFSRHNGLYYKLFSINNKGSYSFSHFREQKRTRYHEGTRSWALSKMLYKMLENRNWAADVSKQSYYLKDIENALAKRFNLPLYENAFRKGLYKTFQEFTNNTPSVTNITIIYKKNKVSGVLDDHLQKIDLSEYWGLCDGEKRYYLFRKEMNELIPSDRSFVILSYRTIRDFRDNGILRNEILPDGYMEPSSARLGDHFKIKEYFDLDMDAGNLFLEEVFGAVSLPSSTDGSPR